MAFLERQTAPRVDVGATVENASVPPRSAPQIDPADFDASLVELLRARPQRPAVSRPATLPAAPVSRPGH